MDAANAPIVIPVWDRFVRIFHWALVTCVFVNFFLIPDGEGFHRFLGYTASTLVIARIVWGFIGTKYARFADFFPTPKRIIRHLRFVLAKEVDDYPGHNPVGALMMFAMMAVVLGLGITGHMQTMEAYWGVEWVQETHEMLADGLIAFAGLHALAAISMSFMERINLIKAMFTGSKVRLPKTK